MRYVELQSEYDSLPDSMSERLMALNQMSEVFNVSEEAAFYRLKDLDIIDDNAQFFR